MDIGITDLMLVLMTEMIKDGLVALRPLVYLFGGFCLILAVAMTLLVSFGEESIAMLWSICKLCIGYSIMMVAILQWSHLTTVLENTAITAGLVVTRHTITLETFRRPGELVVAGAEITRPLNNFLEHGSWTLYLKPHIMTAMVAMSIITAFSWTMTGLNVAMSLFLFDMLVLLGFLGVAFMVSSSLRWFGFNLVRLVISAAMQLFTLAAWVSIMTKLTPYLIIADDQVTLQKIVLICCLSCFFFAVSLVVPFIAFTGAMCASGTSAVRSAMQAVKY